MINKAILTTFLHGWRKCQSSQLKTWLVRNRTWNSHLANIFIMSVDGTVKWLDIERADTVNHQAWNTAILEVVNLMHKTGLTNIGLIATSAQVNYIYIYIYIEREREREREMSLLILLLASFLFCSLYRTTNQHKEWV